jgi:FtsH-binding integral membrane protein
MQALSVDDSPRFVRLAEKYFYFAMSLLIAAVVIYGFSNTIDHRLIHANPRPPMLLWVHAALFSSWVAFYILQSTLVRIRKVKIHRTLGWVGAALGTSMVAVGPWVAVVMARFDTIQLHRPNRDAFLLVPLTDILAFAIFFGLAIVWRKNPERHRRLMLIGTCVLTGAAFGRMPLMHSALHFYGGIDGLILLGASRDLLVSRRIHTVYLIAIPLLVAAQTAVAQIFIHRAAFWIRISHALLG